jgi:hypothetical protein
MTDDNIYIGLIFTGLAAVVLFVLSICLGSFHVPNSGQHTGYVSSVEQSGIIWKTWTAYIKTDPQSSQEDRYCVTDPDAVSELQGDGASRTLVTVDYSAPLYVWKWQCGSEPSIINSIQ